MSRKPRALLSTVRLTLLDELVSSRALVAVGDDGSMLAHFQWNSTMVTDVISKQLEDPVFVKLREEVNLKDRADFELGSDDALLKCDRLCVPSDEISRIAIMEEAYRSGYAIHPRSTKMYRTLKRRY